LVVPDDLDDLSFSEFWDITEDLTEFIIIPPVVTRMTEDEHIATLRSTGIGISDDTTFQLSMEIALLQLIRSIIGKIYDRCINSQIINDYSVVRWESIEDESIAGKLIFEMVFGIKVEVIIGGRFHDIDLSINDCTVSSGYYRRSKLSDPEQIFHDRCLEQMEISKYNTSDSTCSHYNTKHHHLFSSVSFRFFMCFMSFGWSN
jgi:hypothetical protein